MPNAPEITGEESPADILRMVLEKFSGEAPSKLQANAKIIYQDDIPLLRFEAQVINDLGEFVCLYRLDKMTANVFSECSRLYDEVAETGILPKEQDLEREKTVRHLAYYAMNAMLYRLMLLQMAMFEENFSETMCLTTCSIFGIFADIFKQTGSTRAATLAKGAAKDMLDATIDRAAKKRREMLVHLLNSLSPLQISTGRGRPLGSVKSEDVKAQEATEFEKRVEETIRALRSDKGRLPTKTAVAKALNMGGLTKEGTDTSLSVFSRKLNNLKIDYNAIPERVKLHK